MDILRFEELEDSYWCYQYKYIIGFILLKDGQEEAEEHELSLHQFNKLFFTGFTIEQFIQAIQQQEAKDFTEIVETVIQYSETPNITIIKATRLFHELFPHRCKHPLVSTLLPLILISIGLPYLLF